MRVCNAWSEEHVILVTGTISWHVSPSVCPQKVAYWFIFFGHIVLQLRNPQYIPQKKNGDDVVKLAN